MNQGLECYSVIIEAGKIPYVAYCRVLWFEIKLLITKLVTEVTKVILAGFSPSETDQSGAH